MIAQRPVTIPPRAGLSSALVAAVAIAAVACDRSPDAEARDAGTGDTRAPTPVRAATDHRGPTTSTERGDIILHPPGLGSMRTSIEDIHGDPIGVACSTCHAELPARMVASTDELSEFHTELEMAHGDLSCGACHDRNDRDKLRLVEGEAIPYTDVVMLCAQCHSGEYRSYVRGAHGGMQGYWDRQRGERTRLSCVSCHDPHDPAFPQMMPAPPPRDRFFEPSPRSPSPPDSDEVER